MLQYHHDATRLLSAHMTSAKLRVGQAAWTAFLSSLIPHPLSELNHSLHTRFTVGQMDGDIQDALNPTPAGAPFDDPQADIILSSSGCSTVYFRTHKKYLVDASPVFKDMISLGPGDQPISSTGDLTIVDMHEQEEDLRTLLLFCHPGALPDLPTDLRQLYRLVYVAHKYMLDSVIVWLRKLLIPLLNAEPVGGYILARKFRWKEEAELAARQCLTLTLDKLIAWHDPVLCDAPMSFFQDLLWYHRTCAQVLSDHCRPGRWKDIWFQRYLDVSMTPQMEDFVPHLHTYAPLDELIELSQWCCARGSYPNPPPEDEYVLQTKVWWETFMVGLSNSLSITPSFDVVMAALPFNDAVQDAASCPRCGRVALRELQRFAEHAKRGATRKINRASSIIDLWAVHVH